MFSFIQKYYSIIFVIGLALVVGLSFYFGYQQGSIGALSDKNIVFSCPSTILDKQRIAIPSTPTNQNTMSNMTNSTNVNSGAYIGSKNGTKYYTPDCPAAQRIKSANIIWFQSAQDATLQGYSKGSC